MAAKPTKSAAALAKRDFEAISELRYQIRRFLRFSEQAVRAAGVTPLQYLLLLHLRGFPGRDSATIGVEQKRPISKPGGGKLAAVEANARSQLGTK